MQLGQSQLFESLRVYLNNSRRLQPVIGLDSITECVTAGAMNRELLYFCNVCMCRCSKSDIRNHIFGSHHRFNYIKAWYPELLIAWQEDSDLSAMAWPLMELAKMVEKKEGPGQAQLLEVREALYQKMATLSELDAVTLIIVLRGGQADVASGADTPAAPRRPSRPAKTVLPRGSEKSVRDDAPSHQTSPRQSSENAGFLDAYTGTKPLIGLVYVVEYRSEDGSSNCFLCHCCRVSSNGKEIIDHLTGSPHLINYLMETCPERVEAVSADRETLQSLAHKVQQDDSRGTLKVVNVPESLCRILAAESYHCCLKVLRGEWKNTDVPENKDDLKGGGVTDMSVTFTPQSDDDSSTGEASSTTKDETETVFTVSLPLSAGPLLVERTPFGEDQTSASPSADLDQIHFPEPEPGLFPGRDDGDGTSWRGPSLFQQDAEDVQGRCPGDNLNVTLFRDVIGSPSGDLRVYEHVTETYDGMNNNNNNHHHLLVTLETPGDTSYTKWQNEHDVPTPNNEPMSAVSYFPASGHRGGGKEFCHASSFYSKTNGGGEGDGGVQHHNQQLLCYQYRAGWAAGLPAGVQYGPTSDFYDPAPRSNAAGTHMQCGDNPADDVCVVPERREQLHQAQRGALHTYWEFGAYWV